MKKNVKKYIKDAIKKLIKRTLEEKKITKLVKTHNKKVHFIPIRYRILGGLLHSMNIQFGNFIEELLSIIIENEKNYEIITGLSGQKQIVLPFTLESDRKIDNYITDCQNNPEEKLLKRFNKFIQELLKIEKTNTRKIIKVKHDIDILYKHKTKNIYYYLEVKYNDDHDTGKYVDINRKFIKTYIGLCNKIKIYNIKKFKPILYFFTPKIMKGNIYIPEKQNIYRGSKLFDDFFDIKYTTLDTYLREMGDDKEIKSMFDELYEQIRYHIDIRH